MKPKENEKSNSDAQGNQVSNSRQSEETNAVSIQKEVKVIGFNSYQKTIIVQPIGYKTGEVAKCPLIVNPDFEFTVTGEETQIVTY